MKRTFDLTMSLIGIIVLSPIMAAIAIAMVISGEGGVIFAHRRLGRLERPFSCYKFRTMRRGAPLAGTHDVSGSWVTPVGKFLRATKLDELPQLFNVLAGDMSLVGPRPCLPNQLRVIEERRKVDVFSIRPGMTGLAQLQGIDMSSPEQLAHADNHYMQTRSMAGDVELIMMTVFPPLRRARFEIK